jgi:Cdc6-like AAA superfamily ATPase
MATKSNIDKYIFDLVFAGLEGNTKRIELISLTLSKYIRKENPEIAKKIDEAISLYTLRGSSGMRAEGGQGIPLDSETQLQTATLIPPGQKEEIMPILDSSTFTRIESFIEERNKIEMLLSKNIRPSNSLLLTGPPGTGKTMLAKYIASNLEKNLIVLDLSTSISSLLGKTGHNLKRVLQYAKYTSSVLLLDEFDAIAKRRDDNTDLGEIKRVVNVLLMELEDWPISSVVIATSNHPELLDRAIWRRFDHNIQIDLPKQNERKLLLKKELEDLFSEQKKANSIIEIISELLEGKSAADICKYSNNVKRRSFLRNEDPLRSCILELELFVTDKKVIGKVCISAKKLLGSAITIKEIAEITGLSLPGVQHYLSKNKK